MSLLEKVNGFVWGVPALGMIIGVGILLTIASGGAQFRLFPKAICMFFKRLRSGEAGHKKNVSSYQALCTALAATVGTGNLAGVAGAIAIGGPGAIFWMWICALLGMVTKYAEATLAVRFRKKNPAGEWVGGPMYIIREGMSKRWHWLCGVYCFFGVVAAFGVGNATQINAVIGGVNSVFSLFGWQWSMKWNLIIGIILAVIISGMLLGGAKRIGRIAEQLVPFASLVYIVICFGVLLARYNEIPTAFRLIIQGAFSPKAVTGGVIGSVFQTLRIGASRGVFTNEAGMGTAAIAHASADVTHPVEQGLMGIMEVFLDTIVICTLTGLVIICSGVEIPYGTDEGIRLTTRAFSGVYGDWISVVITLSLCAFAFATVLGWGLYGARCAQYLFGNNAWKKFAILQGLTVVISSVLQTQTVWMLAETVNGLMAIPNLIALAFLSKELRRLTRDYYKKNRPT